MFLFKYIFVLSLNSLCSQLAVCVQSHTVLGTRRPTSATSWVSAQMWPSQPTSAPQVSLRKSLKVSQIIGLNTTVSQATLVCWIDLPFVCPVEFSVLVDVSLPTGCPTATIADHNISSLYQFTISSANTQPTDRGEHTSIYSSHFVFITICRIQKHTALCLAVKP